MPITSTLSSGGGRGAGGASTILLIIQAYNQTAGALNAVKKDLQGLGDSAKKAGEGAKSAQGGVDGLVGGLKKVGAVIGGTALAIYGVSKAFQALMDAGEQGAAFLQTTESFNLMNDAMGVSSTILDQLREKSMGTISDMQLMSYATTAMAGATGEFGKEMANALPKILEIAKAANKANPALGSVDYQFQSLIIGLKRLSPRLIDNTGLQVKLGAAYEQTAASLGKSREELTAEEQQMALLNATLAAGDRLLNQVGGTAESLTDPFGRLSAETENLSNTIKADLAPAAAGLASIFADLVHGLNAVLSASRNVDNVFRSQKKEVIAASNNYEEYVETLYQAALAVEGLSSAQKEVIEIERRRALGLEELEKKQVAVGARGNPQIAQTYAIAQATNFATREEYYSIKAKTAQMQAIENIIKANDEYANSQEFITDQEKKLKEETNRYKAALEELKYVIDGPVGKAFEKFSENVAKAQSEIAKAKEGLFPLAPTLLEGLSEDKIALLSGLANQFITIKEKYDFLSGALKDGFVPEGEVAESKILLQELEKEMGTLRTRFGEVAGTSIITDDQIIGFDKLQEQTRLSEEAIRKETEALREQLNQITFNLAAAQLLQAVELKQMGADDAAHAMNELALKLGLVDQATFEMKEQVINATTAFVEGETPIEDWKQALYNMTEQAIAAREQAQGLKSDLNSIPNSKDIWINVHETYTKVGDGHTYPIDPGRQFGGNVFKGMPYVVGEVGPELFVPPMSGKIVPNNQMEQMVGGGGGGQPQIVINFNDTVVKSEIDLEILAYRIAQRISRRR